MKILITGAAGFIGTNFLKYAVPRYKDIFFYCYDKLTYAGRLSNLVPLLVNDNIKFTKGDLTDCDLLTAIFSKENFDAVINFAAETHVDKSLICCDQFIKTNILGTQILLQISNDFNIKKFLQISTDEVYGPVDYPHRLNEAACLKPSNPYAISKASADLICLSYFRSYNLPVVITRSCNNYGPYQFIEKQIPLMIYRAMNNKYLPVYGNGSNIRERIHVEDNIRAILVLLEKGKAGEIYNVSTGIGISNIDLVRILLKRLNKPESLIRFVKDRINHDKRYAMNSNKIKKEFNWKPEIDLEEGIDTTIEWYMNNYEWIKGCFTEEFNLFIETNYGELF
ncbi:MAG: dTDP-glucose 4,6-dehydratase [Candidatus Coatesbacteria bacterium]|nr:dTDP-glucose 4,6-dehydratase [Candidatus Coatesbacteria bacterium]